MITLRPASTNDKAFLAALLSEVWAHYTGVPREPRHAQSIAHDLIAGPYTETLIACSDDAPIGFAVYTFLLPAGERGSALFLKELFVSGDARGLGLGKRFMAELLRIAQDQGCSRIDWTTDRGNRSARAFYRRIGAAEQDDKVFFRVNADDFGTMLENLELD